MDLFAQKPELLLAEFRMPLGISRKYALALLEFWDSEGVTRKKMAMYGYFLKSMGYFRENTLK